MFCLHTAFASQTLRHVYRCAFISIVRNTSFLVREVHLPYRLRGMTLTLTARALRLPSQSIGPGLETACPLRLTEVVAAV